MSKLLKTGVYLSGFGFLSVIVGLGLSGGPCGPQNMGAFLVALAGVGGFSVGVLLLLIALLRAALQRLRTSPNSQVL
jgi:hypothetical protein